MLKQFEVADRIISCWVNPRDFGTHLKSLIFIHGSGSDHSGWSLQYSQLHKEFNVIAVDLPGHGASPGTGEDEVGKYVDWIKKLVDVLPVKRPVLIGHSLGAAISLTFALHYPLDVSGIVPVGGGIKMPVNSDLLSGLKTNPAQAIDLICKFSLAKENRQKLFDPLKKSMSNANIDVLYNDLSACNKLDLTSDLNKIKTPTLVLCGAEDKMTPPDFSRQIAAGIDGAKLRLIEDAGHMVMLEQPELFNEAITNFAASTSS
jgi:pimeloyl-ACP methyl ester carboxylesterase